MHHFLKDMKYFLTDLICVLATSSAPSEQKSSSSASTSESKFYKYIIEERIPIHLAITHSITSHFMTRGAMREYMQEVFRSNKEDFAEDAFKTCYRMLGLFAVDFLDQETYLMFQERFAKIMIANKAFLIL
jgi:hypothetical protein